MLVLMRRTGQEITIPSLDVSIRIVGAHGNRARIGIDAPADIEIRRAELITDVELITDTAKGAGSRMPVELCCERE